MEKTTPLNKKLLLVEDDIITAAAEAAMLKKNGFSVITASSGEKAINLTNTQHFDLILMDIDLGQGINGSEAAEIILSSKMLPIVFLTSHSEKDIVEKVRSITRYGYVIKNSGDFVLLSSIEMAFELFNVYMKLEGNNSELTVLNEELNSTNEELISTNEHLIEYQKNLEISENKFRQFFENMTEGVAIHEICYDPHGNPADYVILSVNASFEKHTGLKAESVKGRMASELYGTGSPPYINEYSNVVETHKPYTFDTYFEPMDKHFHISVISLRKSMFATVFEDVTNRIRNEEKLRESERKYRDLYYFTPIGLFETNLKDATIKTCNQRYCNMAGFDSIETAIGQNVLHLYENPQEREVIKECLREQGFLSDYVIRLKNRKTGNIFWGKLSAIYNAGNDSIEGAIVDITDLKQKEKELEERNETLSRMTIEQDATNKELHTALENLESSNIELKNMNNLLVENQMKLLKSEADLKESEDRYRQLFEAESDSILLIENENGYILEANNATVALYGYSREELLHMKNTDLSAEPEKTQNVTQESPVLPDNIVRIPLRMHRKKNGTVFPVEITGRFFQWRGRPVHIAAIRDITARINDRNALKEISNELEIFFTVALDLFCIADTDGNFIRVNESWEKILGYKREELEKRKFLDFVHPEDIEATLEAIKTLGGNKSVLNFVNRYRSFDGSYRYIEWQSFPREKLIYAAARDITERKLTENRIQLLLAEKEILLKEVHHRIKNNMYTISNLLYLQAESLSDSSAVNALTDARNRIQSMMLIYDKLYRSADYKNISAKEYLSNLIDDIASVFPGSDRIIINKKFDDFIMNSNILFNAGIIINELITNSLKYAFPDNAEGIISIQVIKHEENRAVITITDNGIGFDLSGKTGGTPGFGLELIKILAMQLNAELQLDGNNGTHFRIEFSL